MVSKEEFNKVFEATSKDRILNQFYYEHIELIKLKQKIDKVINGIDILQEIIYQQPTDNKADDMWLLDKLDGFKYILQGSDEE